MENIKSKAIKLRKTGLTYSLILKHLGVEIPKSTLTSWFKNIKLSENSQIENKRLSTLATEKSRLMAVSSNKLIRQKYLDSIDKEFIALKGKIEEPDTALIALAMIYLGEGSKTQNLITLGNSDPQIIKLFLLLLRKNFDLDENKFRVTVQCRADQNLPELMKFWSLVTNIPYTRFYKPTIDPRTVGKPSTKLDYKGVCRVQYLCADVFHRIMAIIKIVEMGL